MRRSLGGALVCIVLMGCGGEAGPSDTAVGSISVSPSSVLIQQEESAQLHVSVLDSTGNTMIGVPISYVSGDPELVTVSATGLITSAGPTGVTSVTVQAGNKSTSVPVTVSLPTTGIVVGPETSSMPQLGTLQLQPALLDIEGQPVHGATFTYEALSYTMVTVSPTGLVQSLGLAGDAVVTVRSGEHAFHKHIEITQVPTSIGATPLPFALAVGATRLLDADVLDATDDPIPEADIAFEATPAGLLAVDADGMVTAGSSAGAGTVTIRSGELSLNVNVTIVDPGSVPTGLGLRIPVPQPLVGVAVSAAGDIYGAAENGVLVKGSLGTTATDVYVVSSPSTIGVALSKAGDRLYMTGGVSDGLLEVDPTTGEVLRSWSQPSVQFTDVVVSHDGNTIWVAGSGGFVYGIDRTSFLPVREWKIRDDVLHLALHPTLEILYATGLGRAFEIDVLLERIREFDVNNLAQGAAVAPTLDRLFVVSEFGVLEVVDLASGQVTPHPLPGCGAYDALVAPGGDVLYVSCISSARVALVDIASLSVFSTIETTGKPARMALSGDGSKLVVANVSHWFDIIE